jgi:hypothetical protein
MIFCRRSWDNENLKNLQIVQSVGFSERKILVFDMPGAKNTFCTFCRVEDFGPALPKEHERRKRTSRTFNIEHPTSNKKPKEGRKVRK